MLGMKALARRIFGTANDRKVKAMAARLPEINALEAELARLADDELRARTGAFRTQLENGAPLDTLINPAFAVVREAARRTLGQRHFDVQLMGGLVLHRGAIAEMRTGEGKTLVSTLPAYLNALCGKGVHIVTVNDYLARRDAAWMGQIYRFLGLSVGAVVNDMNDAQRHSAYRADVTYGTNNEFGFDFLRDNMRHAREAMVQRGHVFAIVDEVDSILIDEARTPLIISGPVEDRSALYQTVDALIPKLGADDFEIDEKTRAASFTEAGNEVLEGLARDAGLLSGNSLYDIENIALVHHLQQALKAHKLFRRNRDYIVRQGKVVIIDEFTGRMMAGRRYSDGLHQALEARENVPVQPENQTLASITFQNYFRLYDKLAGMTGTASTEATEFGDIYGLEVVEIPTNLPVARIDSDDEIYRTIDEKLDAIVALIDDCVSRGQPVLIGTTSIEKSETLAQRLKKARFHQIDVEDRDAFAPLYTPAAPGERPRVFAVLNARYHEQEARIIAEAGLPGAVTIATNMAGRGTDIQLGGNFDMRTARETGEIEDEGARAQTEERIRSEIEERRARAVAAGGLYVIGTERHESRRIDNQLRGRSGRQGDPGQSKFFLSLQDDLMRIFGSDRMDGMLRKLGLEEGEAIVHPWINRALEKAQQKVEARNFDIRKNLLKFDDVMNDQRMVVFEQRLELIDGQSASETVADMRHDVIADITAFHVPERAYPEQWDIDGLSRTLAADLGLELPLSEWAGEEGIGPDDLQQRVEAAADAAMARKSAEYGLEILRNLEKTVLLRTLDGLWREHLGNLEHLRAVIGFRGYGQRDPLQEYRTEAFSMFESMLANLRRSVTSQLLRMTLTREAPEAAGQERPGTSGQRKRGRVRERSRRARSRRS